MASLTSSGVTVIRAWTEGGPAGKDRLVIIARVATLSSPGNGSATNPIPASAFGLSVIEESSMGTVSDGTIIATAPAYDGSGLRLYNLEQATDANRTDPADFISTTFQVTVRGY